MSDIDWSVFDQDPEMTITCRCETVYRSHAKFVLTPAPHMETRVPCPGCGKTDDARGARGEPETFTIK